MDASETIGPAPALPALPVQIRILCDQMQSMKEDMESLRELILGLASSWAERNVTPAVTGSVVMNDGSITGEQGEDLPQYANNIQAFVAVPLGSLVDQKTKERIWSNQHIDLALLISESVHETTYMPTSHSLCCFSHRSLRKLPILSSGLIPSWFSYPTVLIIAQQTPKESSNTCKSSEP